jgi:hypothetical protein
MKDNDNIPFCCEDIPLVKLIKIKCRKVDQKTLSRIRNSIKKVGLLESLMVSPCEDGCYKILDGELRFDVLMEMGLETAPCIIRDDLDIFTANYQVNHLTPVEEARMLNKALEVVDDKLIADVFGFQRIHFRLPEVLSERLHQTIIKAFDEGMITRRCVRELAEVVTESKLEIFAMMQNTKNFGLPFVNEQIVRTPLKKRQSKRKTSPWEENRGRKKSLRTNLQRMQEEHDLLVKQFREFTAALMLTVVHCRGIITNKAIEKYIKTNMLPIYTEIKAIIESELIEKKGPR